MSNKGRMPLPQPNHAARLAELALGSASIQRCSWRSVALLTDIAAGNAADITPEEAQRFAEEALRVAIVAEILAGREAGR